MHVAITGASSGIGEQLARDYGAVSDNAVTLVARRTERMQALAETFDAANHVATADLIDAGHCTEWLDEATEVLGPVDVLVNNAGNQIVEPFEAVDVERHEQLMTLNLFTPMRLARHVLSGMIERGSGTIVNVASLAAIAPTPFMGSYNASKGGLAAWSESLRGELRGTGVNVVTVYPGPVTTDLAERGFQAYEQSGSKNLRQLPTGNTKTLSKLVRKAVSKGKARVIYPRFYTLARWFPGTTRTVLDLTTPSLREDE